MTHDKPVLGVSACLLGHNVRYDGGHKRDAFIADTLAPHVEFLPVCPEAECGLGIPREAMRLVGDPAAPRLVTIYSSIDHTDKMRNWVNDRLGELERTNLSGFIFKARSPSSGLKRVKVYGEGTSIRYGSGMFAGAFAARFSLVPAEDEGGLNDLALRENFIERVFVRHRWLAYASGRISMGGLVEFHTAHKYLVMSHSPGHYKQLGTLVAQAKGMRLAESHAQYITLLTDALKLRATRAKHSNVLQHITGYFKRDLAAWEKDKLLGTIDQYRAGHVPLIVPVTLIRHYVIQFDEAYLRGQAYLAPHPGELMLRNHA